MLSHSVNNFSRRLLFTSSIQLVKKSKNKPKSKSSPQSKRTASSPPSKRIAFPVNFEHKLISWPSLIAAEIEESLKTGNVYTSTLVTNLKFSGYTADAINGHVVELVSETLDAKTVDKVSRGMPVVLIQKGNDLSNFECVIVDYSDTTLRLKLRASAYSRFEPQVARDCTYSITPSEEFTSLSYLQDFLQSRQHWNKSPGYHLLQKVYRAVPMKSVYTDRRLKHYQELNESQRDAVNAAMNKQRPIICIHGPPGTGKTHVLTEVILQANKTQQKVLVCASTHQAINNLMNRVQQNISKIHNISTPDAAPKSLLAAIKNHTEFDLLAQKFIHLEAEMFKTRDVQKLQKLGATAANINKRIKSSVLKDTQVIFSTLSSVSLRTLKKFGFIPDLVIVEEAGQPIECATWVALFQAPRAILAGDEFQLGPSLRSRAAIDEGMGQSLMSVIRQEHGSNATFLLKEQYRMNELIQKWSSDKFYESKLQPHESVKNIKLSDLSESFNNEIYSPMVFIDTKYKRDNWETRVIHSYSNHYEALFVVAHFKNLIAGGLTAKQIGIITPYSAQVECIKKLLGEKYTPDLIVSSVDAFQGEQREAIIMSLVRNNPQGNIGFISDLRRINVSITRSKRHMCIIGNSKMLEKSSDLSSLLNIFKNDGVLLNSMDYANLNTTKPSKSFKRVAKAKQNNMLLLSFIV